MSAICNSHPFRPGYCRSPSVPLYVPGLSQDGAPLHPPSGRIRAPLHIPGPPLVHVLGLLQAHRSTLFRDGYGYRSTLLALLQSTSLDVTPQALTMHCSSEVIITSLSIRFILSLPQIFTPRTIHNHNTQSPLAFSPNHSINSFKMDSEITMFGDYCRKRNAFESCSRSSHTEHQQAIRPQEASLIHDNEYASTSSIEAAFRAKLDINNDTYIATRARLASMLRVWDAVMARKSYYDRTGYLDDDRNFKECFLVTMQVVPDRARIGYLGPFSWEAIQGPPAYDEYASDSGSDSGYAEEPLTPPEGDLEVVSVVSSDAYSLSFVEADEEAPFPVDWEEDLEELDLEYLTEASGRELGTTAKKRGCDEVDSDQDTYPRKRQC